MIAVLVMNTTDATISITNKILSLWLFTLPIILYFYTRKKQLGDQSAKSDTNKDLWWALLGWLGILLVSNLPRILVIWGAWSVRYLLVLALSIGLPFLIMRANRLSPASIGWNRPCGNTSVIVYAWTLGLVLIWYMGYGAEKSFTVATFSSLLWCTSIGLSEELLYRGFLQSRLVRLLGNNWGLIVASLLFAAKHPLSNLVFWIDHPEWFLRLFNMIASGLVLGYSFRKTKSVFPGAVLHTFWDFIFIDQLFH